MEGREPTSSIIPSPSSFSLILQKAGGGGGGGGSIHAPRPMRPTSEEHPFSQQHSVIQSPLANTIMNSATITSSSIDHVKKKRGRPRKYAPNGTSHERPLATASSPQSPTSSTPLLKKNKGPLLSFSAKKQQLLALGEKKKYNKNPTFVKKLVFVFLLS